MGSLYRFQEEGVQFLVDNLRAYLGDEMGLGKTVQALVAAKRIGARKVTVVCPASLQGNWLSEAKKWYPDLEELEIISYTTFQRNGGPDRKACDVLILDEAHYTKNPKAKRTKAVVDYIRYWKPGRVWLLSGTPMPNDPRELYVPARIISPDRTKSFTAWTWRRTFCVMVEGTFGPKCVGTRNADRLREIFRGRFKGRRLSQVGLDLPPLRVTTQALDLYELPPTLEALLAVVTEEDDNEDEAVSTLRRLLGELKAPLVAKAITGEMEAGQYESIVVMAYHHNVLDTLEEAFEGAGFRVVRVDGKTPQKKRDEARELFQAGKADIFLGQQTASGVGITLTKASELVLVEPAWSPTDNAQAVKRIHRISQDAPCRARVFTIPGTLDEAVMRTIARKTQMIEEVGL